MIVPSSPWIWSELITQAGVVKPGTHVKVDNDMTYVVREMYSYTDDVNVIVEDDDGDEHWLIATYNEGKTTWSWYDEATMESSAAHISIV